jgi:hypothetical protein
MAWYGDNFALYSVRNFIVTVYLKFCSELFHNMVAWNLSGLRNQRTKIIIYSDEKVIRTSYTAVTVLHNFVSSQ